MTPRLNEKAMARIMNNPQELKTRALKFPTACILVNGKRPTYDKFFSSPEAERCLPVIADFVPKIDLDDIFDVIERTPGISDVKREYLCKTVDSRYSSILLPAFDRAEKMLSKVKSASQIREETKSNPYMSLVVCNENLMKGYSGPLPGNAFSSLRNLLPPQSNKR